MLKDHPLHSQKKCPGVKNFLKRTVGALKAVENPLKSVKNLPLFSNFSYLESQYPSPAGA